VSTRSLWVLVPIRART